MTSKKSPTKEIVKSVSIALFVAVLIRSLLFEPFSVPSGSMKPNFIEGDYFFVSKYYYGISRYSFPFGPKIFEGRKFVFNKPARGDVIVFRIPTNPSIYFIKRLVGLPGDKIRIKDGRVYLNGKRLDQQRINNFIDSDGTVIQAYKETQIGGVSYDVLDDSPYGFLDNTPEYIVPEKKYFFMGDNRDNSIDSRVLSGPVGYVGEEYLVGKAEMIFFSNNAKLWRIWEWIVSFNTKRFFKFIEP